MTREEEYLNYVFLKFLEKRFIVNEIRKAKRSKNIIAPFALAIFRCMLGLNLRQIKEVETMHVYYGGQPLPVKI